MRNILALVAAFTLSSSTAITAVACGGSSGTTTKIFNWNDMINQSAGWSSDDLFQFLLNNTNNGIGQTLYKDIVDYVSLSILKTDATFKTDYEFAKTTVTNQLQNEQDSLRAKYGRSWESKWKDILKQTSNGGDGSTGSYSRYFDSKLKALATGIVTQHYVTDNYNNYEYYEASRIQLWLQDLFATVKPAGDQDHIKAAIAKYATDGSYKQFVWVIAKANDASFTPATPDYTNLAHAIETASSFSGVQVTNQVAKTLNDDPTSTDYVVDTNSANSIKGLLSSQQANIARLWMKNQGPIWTKQIVVKFDDTVKDPLTKTITPDDFKQAMSGNQTIGKILNDIKTVGFNQALDNYTNHNIKKNVKSDTTGDLGLNVSLNADKTSIKPAFQYYVDRYVTSNQGIGNSTGPQFNLATYTYTGATDDVNRLIYSLDHQYNTGKKADGSTFNPSTTGPGVLDQTSQYRDEVVMEDAQQNTPDNPIDSGNGTNKVAIFIDEDGLHFVQTPGITYAPTMSTDPTQKLITDFNEKLQATQKNITWTDAALVSDRPGGLTSNPYLDYLQTEFLRQTSNGTTTLSFNLNDNLKTFASDSAQDLNSANWWDYILYFNNNIKNINWNINSSGLSSMLGANITASNDVVSHFTQTLANWFTRTYQQRWNSLQGITSTDTLKTNITGWNTNLDSNTSNNVPPARLNADDLLSFLTNVAYNSIWWYDPNSIKN